MVFRRLCILLLLLCTLPVAHAATCIWELPSDYYCESSDGYDAGESGQSFYEYCTAPGSGGQYTNDDIDERPECRSVCCCNTDYPDDPISDSPISEQKCIDVRNDAGPHISYTDPVEGEACSVTCGGTGDPGGPPIADSFTVSGTVTKAGVMPPELLDGVKVTYNDNGPHTVFTNAQGSFTFENVSRGKHTFRATRPDCNPSQPTERDVQSNIFDLDFQLDCTPGGCTAQPVSDAETTVTPGQKRVRVDWTGDDCTNLQGYIVERCTPQRCTVLDFVPVFQNYYVDRAIEADTQYCYHIIASDRHAGWVRPTTGPDSASASHCTPPMSEYCLTHNVTEPQCFNNNEALHPIVFIDGEAVPIQNPYTGTAVCTEKNIALVEEQCEMVPPNRYTEFCADIDGTPSCQSMDICEECNTLLGYYLDLDARIPDGGVCRAMSGCLLTSEEHDRVHSTDVYTSCGEIGSCYDYTTSGSCQENPCSLGGGTCTWTPLPGMEELGFGVCAPVEGDGDCRRCEDVFGFCNATLCEKMGPNCLYNQRTLEEEPSKEVEIGEYACISKEEMACRFYDTYEQCVGDGPLRADIDVAYSVPDSIEGVRVNGSHEIRTPSDDALGFGVCSWVEDGGYCIKDANRRQLNVSGRVEDDCYELQEGPAIQKGCFKDIEAPRTIVPFTNDTFVEFGEYMAANISVYDNLYTLDEQDARFCIQRLRDDMRPCYPNMTYPPTPVPSENDTYRLYYYAADPAGNLETIKHTDLNMYEPSTAVLIDARLIT